MATLSRAPRSVSPDLLTVTLIPAGSDLPIVPGAPRDTLRAAIARHGGYCDWTVDHTGWVVTLYFPEERTFSGATLEEGLTACLAWLLAPERRDAPAAGGGRAGGV